MLARAIDAWWDEMGRPRSFQVVEVAAGAGTLSRALLALRPGLPIVMVERSAALRSGHGDIEAESRADLPPGPFTGVIFANELLDNLAFDLLEKRDGTWFEVRVAAGEEVLVPATDEDTATAHRLAPDAPDGARIPLQRQAAAFVAAALERLERGRLVLIDYADKTSSLAARPWPEWLRTYRGHRRGESPLDRPGSQDITVEVAVDQLLPPPDIDRTQAEFLVAHGLDDIVAEVRRRATPGATDLESLAARSMVTEAAALTDPGGLGGFRILEWLIG